MCCRGKMNTDEYRKLAETEDRMWYFNALWGRVWAPVAAHAGERA